MADFGAPVAQNVNPGNGLQTLSQLLDFQSKKIGIQRQQQELQTGQYQQQGAQAEAQGAQQAMQERQLLQQAMKTQKATDTGESLLADAPDPITGKPEIDPNKFAAYATRALPLTGAGIAQSVLKTSADKVGLAKSVLGLNEDTQDRISGILRSHIGDPKSTSAQISKEIDVALGGVNTPEAKAASQYTQSLLKHMDVAQTPQAKDDMLNHLSLGYDPANAVRLLRSPQYAMQQGLKGPYVAQVNASAAQPVGRVSGDLEQGIAPVIANLPSGSLGAVGGPFGTPGSGAPPTSQAPPGKLQPIARPAPNAPAADQANYKARIEAAGQEQQAVAQAANDPLNGVQSTRFRNQQILDLIPHAQTGPGLKMMNTLASRLPIKGSGDAYQDIEHYTAQNSAALAKLMGVPGTNLGAETAAAAAGSVEKNPGALAEITKTNDALNTAFDLYNRGLAKVTNNGSDLSRAAAYKQAFGQNLDVNAIRWADAHRRKDADEINTLQGKAGSAGIADYAKKLQVLKSLATTGDLP
jgi:hypothetical protein